MQVDMISIALKCQFKVYRNPGLLYRLIVLFDSDGLHLPDDLAIRS